MRPVSIFGALSVGLMTVFLGHCGGGGGGETQSADLIVVDNQGDLQVDTGPSDPGATDLGFDDFQAADPGNPDPGPADPGSGDDGLLIDVQAVQCGGSDFLFPTFDKNCGSDDDCALVFHTINCCGTEVALGINQEQLAFFNAAEAVCDSQYPGCGCAQDATRAEDGKTAWGQEAFGVSCDGFQCRSHVLPSCDDLAFDYFQEVAKLDWCTGPDQCVLAPSGLCVNFLGCPGIVANQDADWTEADAILAQSTSLDCPTSDQTCECPPMAAASFGCLYNQCVPCEKKCPDGCPCARDFQGCPTGDCGSQECEDLEVKIAEAVGQVDACKKNVDCILMELGPICGSLSCRQVAVSSDVSQEELAALLELGFQGAQQGCDGFHCGCGFLGAPVCIDGSCNMCPPDCSGSCQGLINASQELAQNSRQCWGAGNCVVPDVCSTCGTAVNKQAADKEIFFLGLALKEACGPCDLWCRLMPLPYQAACVSGKCELLSYGNECETMKSQFDALVTAPESLACESVNDCAATSMTSEPFCTEECACAVITNKTAALWAQTLFDEYQLFGCPSQLCACKKCMTIVDCVDGVCQ